MSIPLSSTFTTKSVTGTPSFGNQTTTPAIISKPAVPAKPTTTTTSSSPLFTLNGGPTAPALGNQTTTPVRSSGSGALGALKSFGSTLAGAFGGNTGGQANASSAFDDIPNPFSAPPVYSSYGGKTGVDTTTYGTNIPKGQSSLPGADYSGPQYQAASAVTNAGTAAKASRESQAAALLGQISNQKKSQLATDAVTDASATSEYDPEHVKAINDAKAQQIALESQYQALLAPSSEEQAAQAQADALTSAEGQVNSDLNQKVTDVNKEPVPLGFLQGWGTTFNKDATAKLQTLASQKVPIQLQLARLAATRQAALGVNKERVSNAKDAVTQAYSTYDAQQKLKQPYNLSAGETRYDANGKVIAKGQTAAKNYTATNIPSKEKSDLTADILAGHSLSQIIGAYPDVDSSYISSLKGQLIPKSSTILNPFA